MVNTTNDKRNEIYRGRLNRVGTAREQEHPSRPRGALAASRWAPVPEWSRLGLTACGPSLSVVTAPWAESQAVIESDLFGEKNVTFDEAPTVKVENGRIDTVVVSGPEGNKIGGEVVKGGAAYKIDTSDLDFGTKYTVTATAVDLRGKETTASDSFKTFVPEKELEATSSITAGETYGVGMPITMTFNHPIKNKAAIEERMHVETDAREPVVGAWRWDSDEMATYRPKEYWPANTKVQLNADIKGVNAGDDVYATENKRENFKIGDSLIMIAGLGRAPDGRQEERQDDPDAPDFIWETWIRDAVGDQGHPVEGALRRHGRCHAWCLRRTIPTTTGSDVYNAMRITWSGEYVHSAPLVRRITGLRQRQPRLHQRRSRQHGVAVRHCEGRRRDRGQEHRC